MIDERMEEQASLYVLSALEGDELRAFEAALRQDPELQKLVAALRTASDAVAGSAPLLNPPAALKQRILDEINRREKVVPLPSVPVGSPRLNWLPWALAACFIALCALLFFQKSTHDQQAAAEMDQMRQTIASLEATTNDLHQAVVELIQKNQLMSVRVAMLESLVPDSKAMAVTLWDEKKQNGVLVVQRLPEPPPGKDYQLWVIDPGAPTPIDAGVFQVDAQGAMHVAFSAKSPVKAAGKFAVTIERKGGVPKPEGKMVLLGS